MSWQQCEHVNAYSLAIPRAVVVWAAAFHLWIGANAFALALPADVVVLLVLLVCRSWRNLQEQAVVLREKRLSIDRKECLYVHEGIRSGNSRVLPDIAVAETSRMGRVDSAVASTASPRDALTRDGSVMRIPEGSVDDAPHLLGKRSTVVQMARFVDAQAYAVCRSVSVPGCIHVKLVDGHGKHLEILVFYRYHQREIYRRLRRFLVLQ